MEGISSCNTINTFNFISLISGLLLLCSYECNAEVTELATTLADCPRGRCSDGRCPRSDREKCPEEDCGNNLSRCPGTLLCVDKSKDSCPGVYCFDNYARSCADGTCTRRVYCHDGSDPCTHYEKRCADKTCISSYKVCPEEECPVDRPVRCDQQCFEEKILCDEYPDCSSRVDESNCGPFYKWRREDFEKFLWLLLLIPAIVVCIGCFMTKPLDKNKGFFDDDSEENDSKEPCNKTEATTGDATGNDTETNTTSFINNTDTNANQMA